MSTESKISLEIRKKIVAVENVVKNWTEQNAQSLEEAARNHVVSTQQAAESLATHQETEKKLQLQKEERLKQINIENEKLQQAKKELATLDQYLRTLPPILQQLSENEKQSKTTIKENEEAQNKLTDDLLKQRKQLSSAVGLFSSRLGLNFEPIPGALKMVFTNIDPAKPSRPFRFTVGLSKDFYHVQEVVPALADSDLKPLLDHLNTVHDFSFFIQSVRRLFIQWVKSSARLAASLGLSSSATTTTTTTVIASSSSSFSSSSSSCSSSSTNSTTSSSSSFSSSSSI